MLHIFGHARRFGWILLLAGLCQITMTAKANDSEGRSAVSQSEINFSRDISPILSENCFACHGFDEQSREAGLRLDTFAGATGEDGGTVAIVPGSTEQSEMVLRMLSEDPDTLMPPPDSGRKLSEKQIELLERWIQQGAKYTAHWSFIPPERTEPPAVNGLTHPIDRFIQARLSAESATPAERAANHTLIRRVSLDLIGLPPTVQEVDQFVADADQDFHGAYAELVDRLLSSSHYGERWGRWWLDQARYADSNGYSIDGPRQIWVYRDWVVNALNDDMPFDQFTIEQLAGDLLPDATQSQKIATGFHRNTQINQEGGVDKEQFRIDSVFDRVATTGTVWLGLSIGCAQCHDHKFDPITQTEYYQMFAFLNDQDEPTMTVYDAGVNIAELSEQHKNAKSILDDFLDDESQQQAIENWIKSLSETEKENLSSSQRKAIDKEQSKRKFDQERELFRAARDRIEKQLLKKFEGLEENLKHLQTQLDGMATTLVMKERGEPRKSMLFIKGDFTRPDGEVQPGTPAVLHTLKSRGERANRMDLANWIVSDDNPLTARVIMNRIWLHYFGRGIVESENDFGLQGSSPSHPGLLDWLAGEFVDKAWSLKTMHRLIVTSHAYQQSSKFDDSPDALPGPLLARQQRLRLDAEIVRDVALQVSDVLVPALGGPPVYPPIPDGVMGQGQVKRSWNTSQGDDRFRRGLYTFKFRSTPPPSLNVFDAPDGLSACTRRNRSNTPLQALTLMNDPSFFEFAQALEKIIKRDGLVHAFRRCTSRKPSEEEIDVLLQMDTLNAARALLNLDETITRE